MIKTTIQTFCDGCGKATDYPRDPNIIEKEGGIIWDFCDDCKNRAVEAVKRELQIIKMEKAKVYEL